MILVDFEKDSVIRQHFNDVDQNVLDFILEWKSKSDKITVFTSGSTGEPKSIELQKDYMKASVQMSIDAFLLDKNDVFVCNLSTESIAGKMMIVRAFELKAKLISISPSSNPIPDLHEFERLAGTTFDSFVFAFVPMQIKMSISSIANLRLLKRAKVILIGGASIPEDLEAQLIELHLPFKATYGMTETITHIAVRNLNDKEFTALPKVKLENSDRNTLKIAAPSTGFEWIETNDLVLLNETKDKFQILGRADNVINSGGVKIQLEKVESQLTQISGHTLFCFGLPDETLGTKLCCTYIESNDITLNREIFKGKMPNFEIPKMFYPLAEFKYTKSGKIDKLRTIDAYIEPQVSNK
ncbi:O-succinylbenzoic acid--CoA ligase [Spirosomataceae bacterium TFI 002]|nr:O-succinylbenzoic acid--CoA ligase [Spirosomataceae bacterium TFI 002]